MTQQGGGWGGTSGPGPNPPPPTGKGHMVPLSKTKKRFVWKGGGGTFSPGGFWTFDRFRKDWGKGLLGPIGGAIHNWIEGGAGPDSRWGGGGGGDTVSGLGWATVG